MMLPFTGQLDKILDGSKTMTTRVDWKMYYYLRISNKFWKGEVIVADIWWQNPRTQKPDCYKIGRVPFTWISRSAGIDFTEQEAGWDGFDNIWEYKKALAKHNSMTMSDVDEHIWTQIRWNPERWLDGPHPRKVA